MRARVVRWTTGLVLFSAAITMGSGVAKAQYGSQMPGLETQAPASKDKKKDGPPVNKAEEDAYKAFFAGRGGTPEARVQLGEDFIKKFPQSHYLSGVYGQLTSTYYAMGEEDKMFVAGTKALELNPDNVDVLALMAMAMPRRVKANTPDATQQYQKAESYARHAIELIPNLPKPEAVDDATFTKIKNDELAMAHSGLGLVNIQRQKFEDARAELTQAVQLASNPDPVDYYLLGNADSQASYYNDAAAAYEKCAAAGLLTQQCKARMEIAKKDASTKMSR